MGAAQAIRQVRKRLGESQQKFSNRLGVALMTVSRWETGTTTPDPEKRLLVSQLAKGLELSEAAKALDPEDDSPDSEKSTTEVFAQIQISRNYRERLAKFVQSGKAKNLTKQQHEQVERNIKFLERGEKVLTECAEILRDAENEPDK
jgi:transcriptional regulator with XRE-family HTH domain